MWAAVLDVEAVGIDDDFFDLGGNSVLAALVLTRVRDTWGLEIDLATFAASPTIAALARALEGTTGDAAATSLAPARPAESTPLLPASFAQERLWFVEQLDPGRSAYNTARAWRIVGPLDAGALGRALQYLGRRHETLRTEVVGRDGRPWQRVLPDADAALVVTDLSGVEASAREVEAQRLLAEESLRPFDLARGPLWRVRLLRLDDARHVLVVTMHHIVSDGWSHGRAAAGSSPRHTAPSSPIAIPRCRRCRSSTRTSPRGSASGWTRAGARARCSRYWRARLAGAPAALALPTDRPRPARPRARGARACPSRCPRA